MWSSTSVHFQCFYMHSTGLIIFKLVLAFHDIGHHLSIFILDFPMMEFWNAETCRGVLSTNTLNEWLAVRKCTVQAAKYT
jgi:hypothetical protein